MPGADEGVCAVNGDGIAKERELRKPWASPSGKRYRAHGQRMKGVARTGSGRVLICLRLLLGRGRHAVGTVLPLKS